MKKYSNSDLETMGVYLDEYIIDLKKYLCEVEQYLETYELSEEDILFTTSTIEMIKTKIRIVERGKNISEHIHIKKLYKEAVEYERQQ